MYGSPPHQTSTSRDLNLAFEMPSSESQMEETAKSSSSSSPMLYSPLLLPQEIRPGNLNTSASGLFSELTLEHGDALARNLFGQWTGSAGRRSKNLTTSQPRILDSISHISEIPGLHSASSWNDHSLLAESFGDFSRRAGDPQELQNSESGIHFGSPRTSGEMASLLQFQDAVPCKIRAKRGCATHPRSIAERERRTRISERIKKLQELVPKMDKQLSTAEMLDMALDYIKDLQEQVKNLSKNKEDCTCIGNNGV